MEKLTRLHYTWCWGNRLNPWTGSLKLDSFVWSFTMGIVDSFIKEWETTIISVAKNITNSQQQLRLIDWRLPRTPHMEEVLCPLLLQPLYSLCVFVPVCKHMRVYNSVCERKTNKNERETRKIKKSTFLTFGQPCKALSEVLGWIFYLMKLVIVWKYYM